MLKYILNLSQSGLPKPWIRKVGTSRCHLLISKITILGTSQWCVLTISSPLGVGQAPVKNSWGTYEIKNVAQKKLVLISAFRLIPYTYTQNLEFIHHELACSRSDQAIVVFWQMQKLKLSISKIKSCMLKKSTVFNFLYIFQLIQKVLTSNF